MEVRSALQDVFEQREPYASGTGRDAIVAQLLTGLTVGRYLFIDEIGRNERRIVARVYDIRLQREVALAILPSTVLSGEARERVLRETQAVAKLNHPNVISIYDAEVAAVEGGEALLIAMEYVRGQTLRAWLERYGAKQPLDARTWRERRATLLAAGRGLAAAHAAGIVHRDFAAEHVLVGDDGRVRVLDFGLASEAAEGDAATDQYAYCAILWEALTGQRWNGVSDAPVSVRYGGRRRHVMEAVLRGLALQPADRWPSMDPLLDALAFEYDGKHRRALWLTASTASMLAVSTVAWAGWQQTAAERCSGAQSQIEPIWGTERSDAVGQAVLGTGVAYAASTWSSLRPRLDDYASSWVAMHGEACAATAVRGEQSAKDMDLRMRCLHRAKVELAAVVDVLTRADAVVVERAQSLVGSLPSIERCEDVEALRVDVAPPSAEEADDVETVRVALAEIRAVGTAGNYRDALERAQAVAQQSATIAYGPLQTEVAIELGLAQLETGQYAAGEATYRDALRSAFKWGQWSAAQVAATRLVHAVGALQSRPQEGLAYAETARGLVALAGDLALAELQTDIGDALYTQGKYDEAERMYRLSLSERAGSLEQRGSAVPTRNNLAVTLFLQQRYAEAESEYRLLVEECEATLGPDHPHVPAMRTNLAMTFTETGRYEEAIAQLQLALQSWERTLGARHPKLGNAKSGVATALWRQGKFVEAELMQREVIALWEETLGANHGSVANARTSLGTMLMSQARYEDAEAELRRSIAAWLQTRPSDHRDVAISRGALGEALAAQGRNREAEVELLTAVASLEASGGWEDVDAVRALVTTTEVLRRTGRLTHALPMLERCWEHIRDRSAIAPDLQASVAHALARALSEEPAQRARAREVAAAARALYLQANAAGEPLAELDSWLAQHS